MSSTKSAITLYILTGRKDNKKPSPTSFIPDQPLLRRGSVNMAVCDPSREGRQWSFCKRAKQKLVSGSKHRGRFCGGPGKKLEIICKSCNLVHFGPEMVRNAVHNAFLNTLIMGAAFPLEMTREGRVGDRPPILKLTHSDHLYLNQRQLSADSRSILNLSMTVSSQ